MTPRSIAWHFDNTTLNGVTGHINSLNTGKNMNKITCNTIRSTAESFRPGVRSTSTTMIAAPADPAYATPELWLHRYIAALPELDGQNQVRTATLF